MKMGGREREKERANQFRLTDITHIFKGWACQICYKDNNNNNKRKNKRKE